MDIKFSCRDLGADGWIAACYHTDVDFNKKKTKGKINQLVILINTNEEATPNLREMYSALAHECVHLKQFLKKQLLFVYTRKYGFKTKHVIWKGEKKTWKQWNAFANGFYAHFPWEREAFALEKKLLNEFLESTRETARN